ncbi:hypothetical protein CPB84DRAFT_1744198 [Gymnopilus junonius]|uniref:Uncharacterized protein n=1 Tax=Gymnopilus junonius TaxID=109634 RepID=A0A9P5NXD0_GYMJU|nr:hypothetical protein CPB84DRAFT_1744198 [Gymnopilus junonius]
MLTTLHTNLITAGPSAFSFRRVTISSIVLHRATIKQIMVLHKGLQHTNLPFFPILYWLLYLFEMELGWLLTIGNMPDSVAHIKPQTLDSIFRRVNTARTKLVIVDGTWCSDMTLEEWAEAGLPGLVASSKVGIEVLKWILHLYQDGSHSLGGGCVMVHFVIHYSLFYRWGVELGIAGVWYLFSLFASTFLAFDIHYLIFCRSPTPSPEVSQCVEILAIPMYGPFTMLVIFMNVAR